MTILDNFNHSDDLENIHTLTTHLLSLQDKE